MTNRSHMFSTLRGEPKEVIGGEGVGAAVKADAAVRFEEAPVLIALFPVSTGGVESSA